MNARLYRRARRTAEADPRYPVLKATLLAVGEGDVLALPDPHLDALLARGEVFRPKGRKFLRLEEHHSHTHAALYYARHHALGHGGPCEIVTGYALSDGTWHPHSWIWDGRRVLEPNITPELYYGVRLDAREAALFVGSQLLSALPGTAALLGDSGPGAAV